MTPGGKRDRRFRFLRPGKTKTPRGAMVEGTGNELAKGLGQVNYGSGEERRRAGAENSEIAATIRVLATAMTREVKASDLCELDGATWNVIGAVPWGRREIDITIIRRG